MSLTTSVQLLVPLVLVRSTSPSRFQTSSSSSTLLELPSRRIGTRILDESRNIPLLWCILKVVRVGGGALNNAAAGVGLAFTTNARIDNLDDYEENHEYDQTFYWAP